MPDHPIHLEVEVLHRTTYKNACGSKAAKNTTQHLPHVTCRRCLEKAGLQVAA